MIETRKLVEAFEIVRDYYVLSNAIAVNHTGHTEEAYDGIIEIMQDNINYWKESDCYKLNL